MRPNTIHRMPRRLLSCTLLPLALLISSCATGVGVSQLERNSSAYSDYYFDSITFEIAPISSAMPTAAALAEFRSKLHSNKICHKEQVSFLVAPPVDLIGFQGFWVGFNLLDYEHRRRTLIDISPEDRDLVVFVAYIDGLWAEGGIIRVLGGIQYGPTSFALFKVGSHDREANVLLHEFGHLLGLVKNSGRHPNHDAKHRYHCANKTCAMYWSAPEKGGADFDTDCRRELARLMAARDIE